MEPAELITLVLAILGAMATLVGLCLTFYIFGYSKGREDESGRIPTKAISGKLSVSGR